jgi:hypothetical protein
VTVIQPIQERNNQSIADVLEACRVRLRRGETVETCLAAYPAHRAELASLLPLIGEARGLAHDPDPTYAAGARRRFRATLAAARENRSRELGARYRGLFGLLRRLAVPLVLVVALSVSGLGLVQASDAALPDSPLYTVKQAQENVGQVLARTPQDNALLQVRLANRRFMDFQLAVKEKKGQPLIEKVAVNMVQAADLATDRVLSNEGPHRAELIAELRLLLTKEHTGLNIVANSPWTTVAQQGQALQWQVQADEQRLAAAK